MLIREGDQRSIEIDLRLAAILASVAGAVNAAGFQATGYFSANMTGNVSSLSDNLGLGRFGLAGFFLSMLLAFTLGAFGSGLLIEFGRRRGIKAIYAYSIFLEAALLVLVGLADIFVAGVTDGALIMICLSVIMGIQNAASSRISQARVRTTHVSGMATDIGLGFAALLISPPDRSVVLARLKLYATTIVFFMFAGIVGVVVYIYAGGVVFLLVAAILLAISIPPIISDAAT